MKGGKLTSAAVVAGLVSGMAVFPVGARAAADTQVNGSAASQAGAGNSDQSVGPSGGAQSKEYQKAIASGGATEPNATGLEAAPSKPLEIANNFSEVLSKARVTGQFRIYAFQRFNNGGLADVDPMSATAVGGGLLVQSAAYKHFSGAVGVNTQQYINALTPNTHFFPLARGGRDLTNIRQAYLQYHGHGVRLRGGRQLLDTPFSAPADGGHMMPRAFLGVTATLRPLQWVHAEHPEQLALFLGRITQYASRTYTDSYTKGNKYDQTGHYNGFLTLGANYKSPAPVAGQQLAARAWYYRYYDLANLYFSDGESVITSVGDKIHPLIGYQLAAETASGKARLGRVDAQFYGIKLGLKFPKGSLALVGNYAPEHHGTYENGGLVLPYARLQDNGGVFSSINRDGLMDVGPGYGYGIRGTYNTLNGNLTTFLKAIKVVARYGYGGNKHYNTGTTTTGIFGFPDGSTPVRNQSQYLVQTGFWLKMQAVSKKLSGWKVGENLSIVTYDGSPRTEVQNQLKIIYNF